ncbi:hypothetical protein DLM77_05715 [Leptospira yasudae]|uniref:Uncharacterized protein n=1 Tax=Leptospira yasudae TaxID=2202201 RepID=A0ABX9M7G8_9LEPT|nr:hypothetical protein DLM77_05715 [Leptospira yasudae]
MRRAHSIVSGKISIPFLSEKRVRKRYENSFFSSSLEFHESLLALRIFPKEIEIMGSKSKK